MPERMLRNGLVVLAIYYVASAIWLAVSPHSFYTALGPFGAYNDHYVRDSATYVGALGIGLSFAIGDVRWRVGALGAVTVQNALHAVNHFADIGDAHPMWIGGFDAVALTALTGLCAWLLVLALRAPARP